MDPALALIVFQLRTNFHGKAWQGPTLWGSLRGIDHVLAAKPPAPGRKSIWDQVLHAAYWKYVVVRRLTEAERGSFPRAKANWPRPAEGAPAKAWEADKALLKDMHEQLLAAVEGLDMPDLSKPVHGGRGQMTYLGFLTGIVAHDVYHTGQINLARAILGR
jgi:uncharacterized damage-inducible protein DinB